MGVKMATFDTSTTEKTSSSRDFTGARDSNLKAWNAIADWWDIKQNESGDDGNDMFTQCLLPEIVSLAEWSPGQSILDLGAGSGIICRLFAREAVKRGVSDYAITGLDFSEPMLDKARQRNEKDGLNVEYGYIDLMDPENMAEYARQHPE